MKLLGILLIVLGVIGLVYGGISYTRREKVIDVGPLEVTTEEKETIPLPPILGAAALLGGIALVVASGSASRRA
jgi:drug/metabolite transporter (DMT)-like permease